MHLSTCNTGERNNLRESIGLSVGPIMFTTDEVDELVVDDVKSRVQPD